MTPGVNHLLGFKPSSAHGWVVELQAGRPDPLGKGTAPHLLGAGGVRSLHSGGGGRSFGTALLDQQSRSPLEKQATGPEILGLPLRVEPLGRAPLGRALRS